MGPALIGAFGGAGGTMMSTGIGLLNTYLQYRQQKYDKRLQRQIFDREDTSIRRRVADLRAAGLSPVLAAGQGAGTGQTVQVTPAQFQAQSQMDVMALLKAEADISKTYAEKALIDLQKDRIPAEIRNLNANAWLTGEKARSEKVSSDVVEKTGVPGNSTIGNLANDFSGALDTAVKGLKSGWNSYDSAVGKIVDKIKNRVKERSNNPSNDWKKRIPK